MWRPDLEGLPASNHLIEKIPRRSDQQLKVLVDSRRSQVHSWNIVTARSPVQELCQLWECSPRNSSITHHEQTQPAAQCLPQFRAVLPVTLPLTQCHAICACRGLMLPSSPLCPIECEPLLREDRSRAWTCGEEPWAELLAQDNDWAKVCQAYGRATRKPKGVHAQTQPGPSEEHEAWQTCSQDCLADLINTLPQRLLCTFVLTGSFVGGGGIRVSGESPCKAGIHTLVICGFAIMVLHRQQVWFCSPRSAGDTWL